MNVAFSKVNFKSLQRNGTSLSPYKASSKSSFSQLKTAIKLQKKRNKKIKTKTIWKLESENEKIN